jgi:hypothetical protein
MAYRKNITITVSQLPDLFGARSPVPMLYCSVCGGEYSAHRGDYFAASPGTKMLCCGDFPMSLVVKQIRYRHAPELLA